MIDKLNKLKSDISSSLEDASLSYYYLGMNLYDEIDEHNLDNFQVALGNITIACELLLKTFVAKKIFGCLYPNLNKEYQAILYYPESVSENNILNKVIIELKSFNVKTIGINEAISFFYQLYPSKQGEYKPDLKFISEIRNIAVHVSLLDYQVYLLEKAVYITTKLFLLADEEEIVKNTGLGDSEYFKKILNSYNSDKTDKVKKSINTAKKNLSSLNNHEEPEVFKYEKGESIKEICPVCDSNAISYGYIENHADYGYDIDIFYKQSFTCNHCELSLDDDVELRLANISTYVTT